MRMIYSYALRPHQHKNEVEAKCDLPWPRPLLLGYSASLRAEHYGQHLVGTPPLRTEICSLPETP